ncbi:hypothetical protein ElyMa_006503600 [Elysia marginata]|uniref:Uncharacterized protein n=1 Tax=Elysia marginata TaxID=1093978 RepID=A0AAV4I7W7_9GAST|nr:hypothetical protein ElyMa_006503600 [Elysia marginata]
MGQRLVFIKLLSKGLTINGINMEVSSPNPLLLRGSDGKEVPTTKLLTSDIPISGTNEALEAVLVKKGLTLRSKIKMEGIRDPQGNLTEWLSGRRFVWIDVLKTNIEQNIIVSQIKARLFHKEMVTEMTCRWCLKKRLIGQKLQIR